MNRLSHHSSMFSLANSESIPPPSPPRKSGSAPPSHPVPAPRDTLRRNKPYKSLADLSNVQQTSNGGVGAGQNQPIRLSPLDRSSSQLSLLYGSGNSNAGTSNQVQRQESLLDQARRISLGHTPSPPVRVARHHSQNLHTERSGFRPPSDPHMAAAAGSHQQHGVAAGQVKMTRSMSYVSSFSHLSIAKNSETLNVDLNGAGFSGATRAGSGGGSNAEGLFQNPNR